MGAGRVVTGGDGGDGVAGDFCGGGACGGVFGFGLHAARKPPLACHSQWTRRERAHPYAATPVQHAARHCVRRVQSGQRHQRHHLLRPADFQPERPVRERRIPRDDGSWRRQLPVHADRDALHRLGRVAAADDGRELRTDRDARGGGSLLPFRHRRGGRSGAAFRVHRVLRAVAGRGDFDVLGRDFPRSGARSGPNHRQRHALAHGHRDRLRFPRLDGCHRAGGDVRFLRLRHGTAARLGAAGDAGDQRRSARNPPIRARAMTVLAFGEVLLDGLPSGDVPGGAPMNVALGNGLPPAEALAAGAREGARVAGRRGAI